MTLGIDTDTPKVEQPAPAPIAAMVAPVIDELTPTMQETPLEMPAVHFFAEMPTKEDEPLAAIEERESLILDIELSTSIAEPVIIAEEIPEKLLSQLLNRCSILN